MTPTDLRIPHPRVPHQKDGSWVKAPYGTKLHLVRVDQVRYLVTQCGRYLPGSMSIRPGAVAEDRCCKVCAKRGVRP